METPPASPTKQARAAGPNKSGGGSGKLDKGWHVVNSKGAARSWSKLYNLLCRVVDDLYQCCELEGNSGRVTAVLALLKDASHDFNDLAIQLAALSRPKPRTPIAWEVKAHRLGSRSPRAALASLLQDIDDDDEAGEGEEERAGAGQEASVDRGMGPEAVLQVATAGTGMAGTGKQLQQSQGQREQPLPQKEQPWHVAAGRGVKFTKKPGPCPSAASTAATRAPPPPAAGALQPPAAGKLQHATRAPLPVRSLPASGAAQPARAGAKAGHGPPCRTAAAPHVAPVTPVVVPRAVPPAEEQACRRASNCSSSSSQAMVGVAAAEQGRRDGSSGQVQVAATGSRAGSGSQVQMDGWRRAVTEGGVSDRGKAGTPGTAARSSSSSVGGAAHAQQQQQLWQQARGGPRGHLAGAPGLKPQLSQPIPAQNVLTSRMSCGSIGGSSVRSAHSGGGSTAAGGRASAGGRLDGKQAAPSPASLSTTPTSCMSAPGQAPGPQPRHNPAAVAVSSTPLATPAPPAPTGLQRSASVPYPLQVQQGKLWSSIVCAHPEHHTSGSSSQGGAGSAPPAHAAAAALAGSSAGSAAKNGTGGSAARCGGHGTCASSGARGAAPVNSAPSKQAGTATTSPAFDSAAVASLQPPSIRAPQPGVDASQARIHTTGDMDTARHDGTRVDVDGPGTGVPPQVGPAACSVPLGDEAGEDGCVTPNTPSSCLGSPTSPSSLLHNTPRRRTPMETKQASEEKQARAERARLAADEARKAKLARAQESRQGARRLQEDRADRAEAILNRCAEKDARSRQLREAHLAAVVQRAAGEARKVAEVAWINQLTEEDKKLSLQQKLEDGDQRRRERLEERLARVQEAAREVEMAAERRRAAEDARQNELAEKARRKEAAQAAWAARLEDERRAQAAAREAAKEAQLQLATELALAAQQEATARKHRIEARLKEAAARRAAHLETIRERAALGALTGTSGPAATDAAAAAAAAVSGAAAGAADDGDAAAAAKPTAENASCGDNGGNAIVFGSFTVPALDTSAPAAAAPGRSPTAASPAARQRSRRHFGSFHAASGVPGASSPLTSPSSSNQLAGQQQQQQTQPPQQQQVQQQQQQQAVVVSCRGAASGEEAGTGAAAVGPVALGATTTRARLKGLRRRAAKLLARINTESFQLQLPQALQEELATPQGMQLLARWSALVAACPHEPLPTLLPLPSCRPAGSAGSTGCADAAVCPATTPATSALTAAAVWPATKPASSALAAAAGPTAPASHQHGKADSRTASTDTCSTGPVSTTCAGSRQQLPAAFHAEAATSVDAAAPTILLLPQQPTAVAVHHQQQQQQSQQLASVASAQVQPFANQDSTPSGVNVSRAATMSSGGGGSSLRSLAPSLHVVVAAAAADLANPGLRRACLAAAAPSGLLPFLVQQVGQRCGQRLPAWDATPAAATLLVDLLQEPANVDALLAGGYVTLLVRGVMKALDRVNGTDTSTEPGSSGASSASEPACLTSVLRVLTLLSTPLATHGATWAPAADGSATGQHSSQDGRDAAAAEGLQAGHADGTGRACAAQQLQQQQQQQQRLLQMREHVVGYVVSAGIVHRLSELFNLCDQPMLWQGAEALSGGTTCEAHTTGQPPAAAAAPATAAGSPPLSGVETASAAPSSHTGSGDGTQASGAASQANSSSGNSSPLAPLPAIPSYVVQGLHLLEALTERPHTTTGPAPSALPGTGPHGTSTPQQHAGSATSSGSRRGSQRGDSEMRLQASRQWQPLSDTAASLSIAFQETTMAGLPMLLTAVLLHAAPSCTPSEARPEALPPNFAEAALSVVRVLNNVARLDLLALQSGLCSLCVGASHLMGFLVSYATNQWPLMLTDATIQHALQLGSTVRLRPAVYSSSSNSSCRSVSHNTAAGGSHVVTAGSRPFGDSSAQVSAIGSPAAAETLALLNEVLLLLGYFCLLDANNQGLLMWGRPPDCVLHRLMGIPRAYLTHPALAQVLGPSVASICYNNARNCELMAAWYHLGHLATSLQGTPPQQPHSAQRACAHSCQCEPPDACQRQNKQCEAVEQTWPAAAAAAGVEACLDASSSSCGSAALATQEWAACATAAVAANVPANCGLRRLPSRYAALQRVPQEVHTQMVSFFTTKAA